jgi:hypothetical protein
VRDCRVSGVNVETKRVIWLGAKARRLAVSIAAFRRCGGGRWKGAELASQRLECAGQSELRRCFAGRADFGYRNDDAMKSKRYQAFTAADQSVAVFTTRWRFVAERAIRYVGVRAGRT